MSVEMPPALASIVVRGSYHGEFILAHSCTILTVRPRENPSPSINTRGSAVFLLSGGGGQPSLPREGRLIQGAHGWLLADEEWTMLRKLIGDAARLSPTRGVLSTLLDKEGSGRPWSYYESYMQKGLCVRLKKRLIAEDKWNAVIEALRRYRSKANRTAR